MMTQSNNGLQPSDIYQKVDYYEKMPDQETAEFLRRIEERVYSYAGDVMDGWLGMADQFSQAKARLARQGSSGGGRWSEWVDARFKGFISIATADRLASLGER